VHFLKESRRVLKKDGKIVIISANAGFNGWVGNSAYGGCDMKYAPEERAFMLFTTSSIKNLLAVSGFKVDSMKYVYLKPKSWTIKDFVIRSLGVINQRWSTNILTVASKA
jgi:hypothetical protein